ncbi:MAG TPA: choice-of-anchor R domain-containing protein, partial [Pseudobdellovibrionaceae bacterium]|nr:choice-of-anchor R domain-containing protein [Pseudobdellovibrionaceae bacterium]
MKTTLRTHLVVSLILSLQQIPRSAQSTVLFDDFDPSESFAGLGVWTPEWSVRQFGANENFGNGFAAPFTIQGGSFVLNTVTLVLQHIQETTNLVISIVADDEGKPTGTLVETLASDPPNVSFARQALTFNSPEHPVMIEASKLWLIVEPNRLNIENEQDNAVYDWAENNHGVSGQLMTRYYDFNRGQWGSWTAFQNVLLP